jgi:hypothetical protein
MMVWWVCVCAEVAIVWFEAVAPRYASLLWLPSRYTQKAVQRQLQFLCRGFHALLPLDVIKGKAIGAIVVATVCAAMITVPCKRSLKVELSGWPWALSLGSQMVSLIIAPHLLWLIHAMRICVWIALCRTRSLLGG